MNFVKGQTWTTQNPDAVIRILDVTSLDTVSFEVLDKTDGWFDTSMWLPEPNVMEV